MAAAKGHLLSPRSHRLRRLAHQLHCSKVFATNIMAPQGLAYPTRLIRSHFLAAGR